MSTFSTASDSTKKKPGVKKGSIRGSYKPRAPKLGVLGSKKILQTSSSSIISPVKEEEINEAIDAPTELEIETSISPEVIEQNLTEEELNIKYDDYGDTDNDPYNEYRFTKTKTNSLYEDNLAVIRNKAMQRYGSWVKQNISREQAVINKNQSYINKALQKV